MSLRPPAAAGLFYPAGKAELRRAVEALLAACDGAGDKDVPERPRALVVPHAGYVYSGAVAAQAYRRLDPWRTEIRRVVLAGPAHRAWLSGMAVPAAEAFLTPLGVVPVDRAAVEAAAVLPGVAVSDLPHAQEHCLEVQLPFLQLVLQKFSIVPVVVGDCGPQQVADLIDALWTNSDTLLVISSDLSHYHPYDEARRLDLDTCTRILARRTDLTGDQACGSCAINGLLRTARAASLDIELLDVRNSGDTAGDRSRVVGYAAFALH